MLRYETPPSALHTAQAHELPVVISFHMLDFPATKRRKQTTNPLINMAKRATCFGCGDTWSYLALHVVYLEIKFP